MAGRGKVRARIVDKCAPGSHQKPGGGAEKVERTLTTNDTNSDESIRQKGTKETKKGLTTDEHGWTRIQQEKTGGTERSKIIDGKIITEGPSRSGHHKGNEEVIYD
jgi:hypothetical protein